MGFASFSIPTRLCQTVYSTSHRVCLVGFVRCRRWAAGVVVVVVRGGEMADVE